MTDRPSGIEAGPHTRDDGYYGPDSVTWRVSTSPVNGIAAVAAAMIQMLNPPVMYVIDQGSRVRDDPARRARRTGDYSVTITYGDKAAADQAGESLRRLHATRSAVDPRTGAQYRADDPDLLNWVHNALTWAMLRAYRTYGPSLDGREEDAFVAEQRNVAARLVGCVVEDIPATVHDLDDYMTGMLPQLAMSTPALWFRDMMVPSGAAKTPDAVVQQLTSRAGVLLMAPEHQDLYGFAFNRLEKFVITRSTRALVAVAESKLPASGAVPQVRDYVDTHAFGAHRVRAVAPQDIGSGTGNN